MQADDSNARQPPAGFDAGPRLRPLEVRPVQESGQVEYVLHDPSGLAGATLQVSHSALQVLALLDGTRTIEQVQQDFSTEFQQIVRRDTLVQLLEQLEQILFLEGPAFEAHYREQVASFLRAPTRRMDDVSGFGIAEEDLVGALNKLLPVQALPPGHGAVRGLMAPHLDYPRGQPCYLKAYSALIGQEHIRRFVILGTNHCGRSTSVVGTVKDFETPLGISRNDRDFLAALERRCGTSLRLHEYDHKQEHSIELQVLLLQHVFGADSFTFVPLLCPSPCGPTGTAPLDGQGVDLQTFGHALRDQLSEDPATTCVIASADLSHTGQYFGDDRQLDEPFMKEIRQHDERVLAWVARNDAEGLRRHVVEDGNPTRICSVGCIYALMTALPGSDVQLLEYHQAINAELQNSVSCAAAVFQGDS